MGATQPIELFFFDNLPSRQRLAEVNALLTPFSLDITCQITEQKITQKWLKSINDGSLLIDDMGDVFLIASGMKVTPNWSNLQQRVVKAGRKTELLLKAMQLQVGMTVIDATAGFGYDSLILASTGAHVNMIEQQPLLYVLLQLEQQKMLIHTNWQKLMSRLTIVAGDAMSTLATLPLADRVYLDPMFPTDSYKSAVNKNMQILHSITAPPTYEQEQDLLKAAIWQLKTKGKVIVKRPKNAPNLANISPKAYCQNELIRYDEYEKD